MVNVGKEVERNRSSGADIDGGAGNGKAGEEETKDQVFCGVGEEGLKPNRDLAVVANGNAATRYREGIIRAVKEVGRSVDGEVGLEKGFVEEKGIHAVGSKGMHEEVLVDGKGADVIEQNTVLSRHDGNLDEGVETGEGEVGLVVGIGGVCVELEHGAGGKGYLLEGVRTLKGMDILEDDSNKADDVLGSGRGTKGVARRGGGIQRADRDSEFRSGRGRASLTLLGIRGMGKIAGVAGRRGL